MLFGGLCRDLKKDSKRQKWEWTQWGNAKRNKVEALKGPIWDPKEMPNRSSVCLLSKYDFEGAQGSQLSEAFKLSVASSQNLQADASAADPLAPDYLII